MQPTGHFSLREIDLPPSAEWPVTPSGWCIVRLSRGVGYSFAGKQTVELAEGELLVVPPGLSVALRASQLGNVQLHYLNFQPDLLSCLLTLSERQYFDALAAAPAREIRHLPVTDAASGQFAALCQAPSAENVLLQRCQILAMVATLFPPNLKPQSDADSGPATASTRLVQMMEKLPEMELVGHSPDQLARMCGCSLRHFTRLFHARFGISLRAKQTQLRLEKARQLLCETDAKVINVALESGYRHLGLFNAMFKKRFGTTPTKLRQMEAQKPRPRGRRLAPALLLLFLLLFPLGIWAADEPGKVAPTVETPAAKSAAAAKPAPATNSPAFAVSGYAVQGNTTMPEDIVRGIFAKYTGTNITFELIRKALGELQLAYRARGYVTVAVSLPQQQLTNGIVKVTVTEGRLAEIDIVNACYYSSNNIRSSLPSLQTNMLLNNLVLQQELDRANQNLDRQIYPEIGPGPEPGTTSLHLKIKDRLPLHGRIEVDNYSTPGTPELRVNSSIQYNNLWQLDHQLGLQYSFSPERYKQGNPAFYDQPLIANYSAYYRMPISTFSDQRAERDIGIGAFGYDEVTKRFRAPALIGSPELVMYASRSSSDTGNLLASDSNLSTGVTNSGGTTNALLIEKKVFNETVTINEDIGFRVSDPLPTFWGISSTISAGLDRKAFRSQSSQTTVIQGTLILDSGPFPIPGPPPQSQILESSINYVPFAVSWAATRQDKWGVTGFNLNNSFNFASLARNQDDFRKIANSTKADGNYYIADAGLNREQKLTKDWSLRLSADGQWANQPLINNEQFGIGGNAGVRGYRDGQQYGDTGWRAIFEPHTQLANIGMVAGSLPMYARFSMFTDYGRVYLLDPANGAQSSVSLWGAGCSVSGSIGAHCDYRLTYGVPLLNIPGVSKGTSRISFFVALQF
ncbi:MAG: Hemolysin activation/secretion protein-like protein [Pedosphaera sp.]|nr:Hemolysin activation/secretion protein-like protein [Pedosphaera sp.]